MLENWLYGGVGELLMVLLSAVATYAAILLYTRCVGLRSFSKMSAADFAMTVAVGSLFASTISSPSPSLAVGLTAIACLFAGQWLLAVLRVKSPSMTKVVDNQPILLMRGTEVLHENLKQANVTEADLHGKLREANVFQLSQVLAVVFEATGDVSVLHSQRSGAEVDAAILSNVAIE